LGKNCDRDDFGDDFNIIEGALFTGATTVITAGTEMTVFAWKTYFQMEKTQFLVDSEENT